MFAAQSNEECKKTTKQLNHQQASTHTWLLFCDIERGLVFLLFISRTHYSLAWTDQRHIEIVQADGGFELMGLLNSIELKTVNFSQLSRWMTPNRFELFVYISHSTQRYCLCSFVSYWNTWIARAVFCSLFVSLVFRLFFVVYNFSSFRNSNQVNDE